ncbi:MAG TPA: VCBS domain-containing protein [Ramlibacter sp.]|jgi:VCBS repeat-containing protein|nr:VCBS domain-containing protein [Ramlibacter sp.]
MKPSRVSFSKTPQAKCDFAVVADDGPVFLDVMANDKGGKAKSLYSVAPVGGKDLLNPVTTAVSKLGAEVKIVNGRVSYNADTSAQIAALDDGEFLIDSFTYAIRLGNGTISTATVFLLVRGSDNDGGPVFGGDDPVTETVLTEPVQGNGTLTAEGTLRFNAEAGENYAVNVLSIPPGPLGTLTAQVTQDPTGAGLGRISWDYVLAPGSADYLSAGQSRTENFILLLEDGNPLTAPIEHTVQVVVQGTDDPTTFSGDLAGGVTEPAGASGTLSDTGTIVFHDVDQRGGHMVTAVNKAADAKGTLDADVSGATTEGTGIEGTIDWTYTVDAAVVKALGLDAGETWIDRFTVILTEGGISVSQAVEVTITGTDDVALVGLPTMTNAGALFAA